MVHHTPEASASNWPSEGISVELIDPRTVAPLDIDTIAGSVAKTGRLLIVDETFAPCGIGAEIAAQLADRVSTIWTRRFAGSTEPLRPRRTARRWKPRSSPRPSDRPGDPRPDGRVNGTSQSMATRSHRFLGWAGTWTRGRSSAGSRTTASTWPRASHLQPRRRQGRAGCREPRCRQSADCAGWSQGRREGRGRHRDRLSGCAGRNRRHFEAHRRGSVSRGHPRTRAELGSRD